MGKLGNDGMDTKLASGEPRALISRNHLLHNARLIRQTIGPDVKFCAVIKANAYGHGADIVCDTLLNFSADDIEPPLVDAFAVACLDEAIDLPPSTVPIYIFRPVENAYVGQQREKLETAIRRGWILTVCSITAAQDVARLALAVGRQAHIQVMIDTGMSRSGVSPQHFSELMLRIGDMPSLRLIAVCSHFSCSEEADNPATQQQFDLYHHTLEQLSAQRPLLPGSLIVPRSSAAPIRRKPAVGGHSSSPGFIRHIANSGAVFLHRHTHLDMVRPGISLYGIDPACHPCLDRQLKPVLRWVAPLVMIHDIAANTPVGYGQTWRSPRSTRIGLVPVGYADGYLRALSSVGITLVNGLPCPVVGRVSMDLITIDLGPAGDQAIGDEVTLLDADPLSPASAYALAQLSQTIPYELFCRIGSRIPRIAVDPVDVPIQTQSQSDAA